MSRDFERRIKSEIEEVLNQFGVEFQHTQRSNHPAVQFEVNGRKMLFTYSHSGDYRQHLNARSDLRNLLTSAGLKPKEKLPPFPQSAPPIPEEEPLQQIEEEVKVTETPATTPIETPAEVPRQAILNENGYGLYQVKGFRPNQLIAIELDRDLMCSKGHMLLIPLNRPNTVVEMSREQFDVLFEPVELPAAVPEPVEPEPVQEVTSVAEEEPVADDIVEEEPEIEVEEEPDPFPINRVQEGVSGVKRPRGRPPRAQNWVDTPYRRVNPRNVAGLGPQAARVLVSMAYQSRQSGKVDLTPDMLNGVLLAHDRRQYASRVKDLVNLKMVERGLPIPEGSGYHYKVTTAGYKTVPKLGPWPWLYDGLSVPKWASQKL